MTHEEVTTEVQTVNRICRGPLLLSEEQLNNLRPILNSCLDNLGLPQQATLHVLKTSLESLYNVPSEECKDLNALINRVLILMFARKDTFGGPRCGYDINKLILETPFDGKEHIYTCPNCGVTDSFIAPLSEEFESTDALIN